jgi:hypothetical protein
MLRSLFDGPAHQLTETRLGILREVEYVSSDINAS